MFKESTFFEDNSHEENNNTEGPYIGTVKAEVVDRVVTPSGIGTLYRVPTENLTFNFDYDPYREAAKDLLRTIHAGEEPENKEKLETLVGRAISEIDEDDIIRSGILEDIVDAARYAPEASSLALLTEVSIGDDVINPEMCVFKQGDFEAVILTDKTDSLHAIKEVFQSGCKSVKHIPAIYDRKRNTLLLVVDTRALEHYKSYLSLGYSSDQHKQIRQILLAYEAYKAAVSGMPAQIEKDKSTLDMNISFKDEDAFVADFPSSVFNPEMQDFLQYLGVYSLDKYAGKGGLQRVLKAYYRMESFENAYDYIAKGIEKNTVYDLNTLQIILHSNSTDPYLLPGIFSIDGQTNIDTESKKHTITATSFDEMLTLFIDTYSPEEGLRVAATFVSIGKSKPTLLAAKTHSDIKNVIESCNSNCQIIGEFDAEFRIQMPTDSPRESILPQDTHDNWHPSKNALFEVHLNQIRPTPDTNIARTLEPLQELIYQQQFNYGRPTYGRTGIGVRVSEKLEELAGPIESVF